MENRLFLVFLLVAVLSGCGNGRSNDAYLASLPKSAGLLEPADSLDLDAIGIMLPSRLVKYDRWVVIKEAQAKHNLVIINLDTHSKMETLRVGRGPGEMLQGQMAYLNESKLVLTEANALNTVSMDLSLLREGYIPPYDTIGTFKSVRNATSIFTRVDGGYLSIAPLFNTFGGDVWYSVWDEDGFIGNSVSRPYIANLEQASPSTIASFFYSSFLKARPDKKRVCVALASMAALSFASIEDRKLSEIKRIEYNEPVVGFHEGEAYISYEESTQCFIGIASDEDYVYLLYSGRKWPADEQGIPSYEGNHLLIYDWDGNFVKRYNLSRNVTDIFVDGNELYCVSTYPSAALFVYHLPGIS